MPKQLDPCPLCQKPAKSSFEHVPPRACANSKPVRALELEELLTGTRDKGRIIQQGHGYDSLCKTCNAFLGGACVRAFTDWDTAARSDHNVWGTGIKGTFYPLRVIKAVIGMFFSTNTDFDGADSLREFILNKDATGLPEPFRLFAFGRQGPLMRATGSFGLAGYGGDPFYMVEVHTEAIGYVLSLDGERYSPSFTDITDFANAEWDQTSDIEALLYPLVVASELPGDYRSVEMVQQFIPWRPDFLGKSGLASRVFYKKDLGVQWIERPVDWGRYRPAN